MTEATQTLDTKAVASYLRDKLDGFDGPVRAQKFEVGQSNPTFLLETAAGKYVLRRKPPGQLLKSAHAVDREFRVQRALANTDVPVARMHVLCEDDSIIGSMFYVMDFVDGRNFAEPLMEGESNQTRTAVIDDMCRVLAALHSVDIVQRSVWLTMGPTATIWSGRSIGGPGSTARLRLMTFRR